MFSIKQSHGAVDKNVVYMFFPKKMEFMFWSFTKRKEGYFGICDRHVESYCDVVTTDDGTDDSSRDAPIHKVTPICRVVWYKKQYKKIDLLLNIWI